MVDARLVGIARRGQENIKKAKTDSADTTARGVRVDFGSRDAANSDLTTVVTSLGGECGMQASAGMRQVSSCVVRNWVMSVVCPCDLLCECKGLRATGGVHGSPPPRSSPSERG